MNLWDYLTRRSRARFHYEVYSDCIKGYRNSIKDTECVPDFDVARYIIEHPNKGLIMPEDPHHHLFPWTDY